MINSPGWVPGSGHAQVCSYLNLIKETSESSTTLSFSQAERFLANVTSLVGGCPISTSETIDCLRTKTFAEVLAASQNITTTYNYQMQPRVDGVVLPEVSRLISPFLVEANSNSSPRLPSTSGLLDLSIPTSSFSSVTQLVRPFPVLPFNLESDLRLFFDSQTRPTELPPLE